MGKCDYSGYCSFAYSLGLLQQGDVEVVERSESLPLWTLFLVSSTPIAKRTIAGANAIAGSGHNTEASSLLIYSLSQCQSGYFWSQMATRGVQP
jgi:hypothetical protein